MEFSPPREEHTISVGLTADPDGSEDLTRARYDRLHRAGKVASTTFRPDLLRVSLSDGEIRLVHVSGPALLKSGQPAVKSRESVSYNAPVRLSDAPGWVRQALRELGYYAV